MARARNLNKVMDAYIGDLEKSAAAQAEEEKGTQIVGTSDGEQEKGTHETRPPEAEQDKPKRKRHPIEGLLHDDEQRATFICNRAVLRQFQTYCRLSGKTIKSAITDAMIDYLKKNNAVEFIKNCVNNMEEF